MSRLGMPEDSGSYTGSSPDAGAADWMPES